MEDQKVHYDGHLFLEEVVIFWDTKRQLLILELGIIVALTWKRFKEEFDKHFFRKTINQQKSRELTHGRHEVAWFDGRHIFYFNHHTLTNQKIYKLSSNLLLAKLPMIYV